MGDAVRLQETLDEIAETVQWAVEWIDELRENDLLGLAPEDDLSDMPGLRAELARLRVIADVVEPSRVRDEATGQRLYLAPDDAARRTRDTERALDRADAHTHEAYESQQRARDARDRRTRERSEEIAREEARDEERRNRVRGFLSEHGPSTIAEITAGTGLERHTAEWTAKSVAKRRPDQRFELLEPTTGDR